MLSLAGDNAVLSEWVDQLVAVTTEQGFPFWRALGTIFHGWVKAKNGDVTEGVSLLRSGSTAYRATGAGAWIPYQIALLVRACEIAQPAMIRSARFGPMPVTSRRRLGSCWMTSNTASPKTRTSFFA